MKENIKLILTTPSIRNRILWTIILVTIYLIGINITLPNVQINTNNSFDEFSFFGVLNLIGGGGLRRFSFFALGISPYITATIIMNLLSTELVPPLKRLMQAGEKGKAKVDLITKGLTLVIAVAQAIALLRGLSSSQFITFDNSALNQFYIIIIMLAGSLVTVWIGNIVTRKGIGNGISIIVFAGIVSNMPTSFIQMFNFLVNTEVAQEAFVGALEFVAYIIGFILVLSIVILFQESIRKIPVQHSRSSFARRSEELAYIPIKMNPSGIMPLIFATAAITTPLTIASFLTDESARDAINNTLSLNTWSGMGIYAALIVVFSFFYNQIAVNAPQLSENFLKQNTYIPGIRPGEETRKYIQRTVSRISLVGSLFLVVIAILPLAVAQLTGIPSSIIVSGSALIIAVSVIIQTTEQMRGLFITHKYKKETETGTKNSFKKKATRWLSSDSFRKLDDEIEQEDQSEPGDSFLW